MADGRLAAQLFVHGQATPSARVLRVPGHRVRAEGMLPRSRRPRASVRVAGHVDRRVTLRPARAAPDRACGRGWRGAPTPSARWRTCSADGVERASPSLRRVRRRAVAGAAHRGGGERRYGSRRRTRARRLRRPEAPHPRQGHRARRPGGGRRGRDAAAGRRAAAPRLRRAPGRGRAAPAGHRAGDRARRAGRGRRVDLRGRRPRRGRGRAAPPAGPAGGQPGLPGGSARAGHRVAPRQLHVAPDGGPDHLPGRDRPALGAAVRARRQHLSEHRPERAAMLDWSGRLAPGSRARGTRAISGSTSWSTPIRPRAPCATLLAEVHPRVDGATEPLGILAAVNARAARRRPAGERGVRLGHARARVQRRWRAFGGAADAASCTRGGAGRGVVPCEPNGAGAGTQPAW